jgi:hypothetical protein
LHRRAPVQQLLTSNCLAERTEKVESLSLQERNRNMQLLILQHDKDGQVEPGPPSRVPRRKSLHPQYPRHESRSHDPGHSNQLTRSLC